MKHKLKVVATMVLFITAAITGGCQKDDEITARQTAEGTIQVTTISFDEFKADMKAYTELQNAVRAGREKSGVMHRDGFFYNTDDVTMISYTGYKTYTFPIYREDDKGIALENLVIRVSTAGATDSYIFQYDFTPGEVQDVYTGKPIINLSNKTWVTKTNGGDEDSIIYKDSAGNCYVYAGDYYQDADNLVWFEVQGVPLRFERIECPEGHNDYTLIQDGQSNGGSDSSGSGNTGNPGGSGLGSININVVIPVIPDYNPIQNPSGPSGGSWGNHPNRPVITRPAVNLFYKLFFDELTKQERIVLMLNPDLADGLSDLIAGPLEGWPDRRELANEIFDFAMEHEDNKEIAEWILDYLNEEEVSEESIEEAYELIELYENIETELVLPSPDLPIADMEEFLECINMLQSATLTIYVDQPKANSLNVISTAGVGHTFIGIKQGTNESIFGFYPAGTASPLAPSDPGVMGDDSSHSYDVSITITVSPYKLAQILDASIDHQDTYNLNSYNCSDFGIDIANICDLDFPDCSSGWGVGAGSNPAKLGQHIRGLPDSPGRTINRNGGNAPTGQKNCD